MDSSAAQVETEHVHRVYDDIAFHFSHTRYKPWPKIAEFLAALPSGSFVADIGCGNGKYIGCPVRSGVFIHGSDRCRELLEIARSRDHEVLVCDNLLLPYKDNCFDAVLSIAVIHHFASKQRRREAIEELARVLAPKGKMIIYVWAMEQQKKKFDSQDVFVPWHLQRQFNRKEEEDATKDSKSCFSHTYQRYYHVFKEGELRDLIESLPNLQIIQDYYDHENWCIVAEKIA